MLEATGIEAVQASSNESLRMSDRIIIPGVGSFDSCIKALNESGLRGTLDEMVMEHKVPVLGICLGAQIMGNSSEEGIESGLRWIDMKSMRIRNVGLPVPHMSWETVTFCNHYFETLRPSLKFYFSHSFTITPENPATIAASFQYGDEYAAVVQQGHLVAAQFHPEKSHRYGRLFLQWFNTL